jgi:thiamine phosphate synthase YjbQ (UPF0047 family)
MEALFNTFFLPILTAVMHTSASLTINENSSPDVPLDLTDALNRRVRMSLDSFHSLNSFPFCSFLIVC